MRRQLGAAWLSRFAPVRVLVRTSPAWMLFIVSIHTFSGTWAQSLSFSDEQQLLDAYRRQHQSGAASVPQMYRAPDLSLSTEPVAATADTALVRADSIVPISDSLVYDDSLPKPGGPLVRFGAEFFRSRGGSFRPPAGPVPPGYRLGPGDRLYVTTWGRVDLEYELAVDPTGQVHVPKVGAVRAFGLSLSDFENKLREHLASIYSDFELSVTVTQIRAVQVHVYGEVVRPGSYTLNALSSLLDVLVAAGGPNERGSFRDIRHTQKVGGSRTVDLYRFFAAGDLKGDQPVGDGDIIFVPVVGTQISIRGEVRRPGIYELAADTRLSDAIRLAGGVRPEAYLGRVLIDRLDKGDQRTLIDCNLGSLETPVEDMQVQDGDDISVYKAYAARPNVVWIDGAVKHPGGYEYRQDMTVYHLLQQAGGLTPDAYRQRADLERNPPDGISSLIQIHLAQAATDSLRSPLLRARDRLVIYDRAHLERDRRVRIDGAVKEPGTFRLFEGMRLSDLVFRAGNPNRSAYLYRAEIARLDDRGATKILHADLGLVMTAAGSERDPLLAQDDHVFIREIPQWRSQELVKIEGQIMFPGVYALAHERETLWELMQRAGGLTDEAFVEGTIFTRKSITDYIERADYRRIAESSVEWKEDTLGEIRPAVAVSVDPARMSRLVIGMERLVTSRGAEGDIELRGGDHIYIPREPSGVQVMGAVAAPGTIQYRPNFKIQHYIERAGDFTKQSQKSGARLIKADGRVFAGGEARSQKVALGDAIFVPTEIKKDKDWWKIVTGSMTLITGMVTVAVLIAQL